MQFSEKWKILKTKKLNLYQPDIYLQFNIRLIIPTGIMSKLTNFGWYKAVITLTSIQTSSILPLTPEWVWVFFLSLHYNRSIHKATSHFHLEKVGSGLLISSTHQLGGIWQLLYRTITRLALGVISVGPALLERLIVILTFCLPVDWWIQTL